MINLDGRFHSFKEKIGLESLSTAPSPIKPTPNLAKMTIVTSISTIHAIMPLKSRPELLSNEYISYQQKRFTP